MTERITEAELRDLDERWTREGEDALIEPTVPELIAEVRRLRGLIVVAMNAVDDGAEDYPVLCGVCGITVYGNTKHENGCPVGSVNAEAKAIREDMAAARKAIAKETR